MPREHSMSCDFPEGCNCGASDANNRETFIAQQARLIADQGKRIAELERDLANVRELWRIANENALARSAEADRWKGIQQEACARRDAIEAENVKLRGVIMACKDHDNAFEQQITALRQTLEYANRRIREGCAGDAAQAIANAIN